MASSSLMLSVLTVISTALSETSVAPLLATSRVIRGGVSFLRRRKVQVIIGETLTAGTKRSRI